MLIITLSGGLVSSVTTDDSRLRELLNADGVVVLDYDKDLDDDDPCVIPVPVNGSPEESWGLAHASTKSVETTVIDTEKLAECLRNL